MTGTVLLWLVHSPTGELIAVTRYAHDAARLAIWSGPGATVRHGDRLALTVTGDMALTEASAIADAMIAAADTAER